MSGFINDLSPEQAEALEKFRAAVDSLPNQPDTSDPAYLRWLRARNFNLEDSLAMYQKHLQWRQEMDIDHIFEWEPPEVLKKYFPGGIFGEDRDGNPVYYDFLGNLDCKGLYRSTRPEDVLRFKIQQAEGVELLLKRLSEERGEPVERITTVLNMENLSYQRQYHWPSIQFIRQLFQIFGENYPERTKVALVIKAPRIFPMAFSIVKHFIEEDTRQKIVVMGDDYLERLQQYISPDQLPQSLGGTCCLPDPNCSDHLNWGGDVPQSYYLMNNTETVREEMETVLVGRGSSQQVAVNVEIDNSLIRYEYISTGYDIGFGLYYKSPTVERKLHASEMTNVVPSKRRNSHVVPQKGLHKCEKAGMYVLRFDNTYSWTRTKEVLYSIQILPPPPEDLPDDVLYMTEREQEEDKFHDCRENNSQEESCDINGPTAMIGGMSLEDPNHTH